MIITGLTVSGFKNIPDTRIEKYGFFPHTLISGENFTGKTTICEAICWAFCGSSINGSTIHDALLLNNQSKSMTVELEFTDNKGATHILKREKSYAGKIYLDNKAIPQNDLLTYIGDKDIFLSIFVVGYFQKYSPKEARELLSKALPGISPENILSKLDPELAEFIPHNRLLNSNELLKECRARLKEIEKEELFLKGQLKALFESFKQSSVSAVSADEPAVREKIEKLEARKLEILKLQLTSQDTQVLIGKRDLLRKEYEHLKSRLLHVSFKAGDVCPSCKQIITEACIKHLEEYNKKSNQEVQAEINDVVLQGKTLNRQIEEAKNNNKPAGAEISYSKELSSIEAELIQFKKRLEDIAAVKAKTSLKDEAVRKSEEINKMLRAFEEEAAYIEKTIEAAKSCNSIKTELQFKSISDNLDKVSLRLEKVVKSTGELKDCFELLYDGKELMLLSNSEKIRAFLEISNLINIKTGLKLPVFIDNAESITHYDKPDTQIFEAAVVKNAPLTVHEA